MSGITNQGFLYGLMPTVGKTRAVAASDVATSQELKEPGLYLIQNLGPDICNVRMFPATGGTFAATTSDMPLSPLGSGDKTEVTVLVSPRASERLNNPAGPNVLHAICSTGKVASLAVTLITRHS